MIDLYCERLGPGFWAEPVNALTNLAFFVSAWSIWTLTRKLGLLNPSTILLISLTAVIGIGSGVFHTFATGWARVLDVVPILVFQLTYLWLYLRDIVIMRSTYAIALVMLYVTAALFGRQFPQVLNGSLTYMPALLLLIMIGIYHLKHQSLERILVLAAAGVFLASLFFRSIDNRICDTFPIGTHFLWHLLNSLILYLLGRAYLFNLHVSKKDSLVTSSL